MTKKNTNKSTSSDSFNIREIERANYNFYSQKLICQSLVFTSEAAKYIMAEYLKINLMIFVCIYTENHLTTAMCMRAPVTFDKRVKRTFCAF